MKQIFALFVIMISFAAQGAQENIIALVNDDPITSYEFENRKKMLMKLNNIQNPDTSTAKELDKYALQTLIDESILVQHAEKVGGKVSPEEITEAISSIEKKNNMPAGHLVRMFNDTAIEQSFKSQIRSELIKMNILSYLSKSVTISPKEIDVAILTSNSKDVKVSAKIYTSKHKDKDAFHKMDSLRKQLKDCNNPKSANYAKFADVLEIDENLSALEPQTQAVIKDLSVNQASRVFETPENFKLAIVCSKEFQNISAQENTHITNFLTNKKVSLKAQKFFDNLRKKAYIKVLNS
jgi:parvulin-like peptidyl-prolyl isomerase